ncbi:MAG: nodulation protein NfeD [Dehalococcoidia bacterium]|nr:nodulation protein NfeD [Dehalococcoidia bacterium]MSQ17637.1 nodulation protein NfeD [Dehalococcoidia bacterium]
MSRLLASSRVFRLLLPAVLVILGAIGLALGQQGVAAQTGDGRVLVVRVDGVINSIKGDLIARTLAQAEEQRAVLVVIELDTPGGLLDSTREIVEELLGSPVPVAVYVSPRGARAGSAGTFITAAANFAVMAPGTNIGAATPVSATGEDLGKTLASKATNDAAALIRTIAQERGRNQEKLEETVRQAVSFTSQEAVDLMVVDFVADDLADLLAKVDGRVAVTPAGPRTLATRGLSLERVETSPLEHFLEFISNPNVAFILLTLGTLGLTIELFNPGLIVPGVVGAILLLLAFLALGNLPVNWAGAAFIVLAGVLLLLETQVSGFGVLGVGAIISFVAGGLLLFTQFGGVSPTLPSYRVEVSRWLLGGTAVVLGATMLYAVRVILQSKKAMPGGPDDPVMGGRGTVTTALAPRGVVQMGSETWTAVSDDGSVITEGESVQVTKIDGLVLTVIRAGDSKN